MAIDRAFWKGYLKLSLVTCRVAMVPVKTESDAIRFHTLNRATGNRVRSRYIDAGTGKVVADGDQVKGYERDADRYVMLEDAEIDSVALESARTIDVETFVPAQSIATIWYDRPHYLLPDDAIGAEAFAVIRAAMQETGMVGIARLVLYRRERAILLKPFGTGMLVWTLRYGDEVRPEADYVAAIKPQEPDDELASLVRKLIRSRTRDWPVDLLDDPVGEAVKALVAQKAKTQRKPKKTPEPPAESGTVIDLTEALKRSLRARKT